MAGMRIHRQFYNKYEVYTQRHRGALRGENGREKAVRFGRGDAAVCVPRYRLRLRSTARWRWSWSWRLSWRTGHGWPPWNGRSARHGRTPGFCRSSRRARRFCRWSRLRRPPLRSWWICRSPLRARWLGRSTRLGPRWLGPSWLGLAALGRLGLGRPSRCRDRRRLRIVLALERLDMGECLLVRRLQPILVVSTAPALYVPRSCSRPVHSRAAG
jgi:hypothetical protein